MVHRLIKKIFNTSSSNSKSEFVTIVSGLPRSGTSMVMKMLEAGGIPPMTDYQRAADIDNPKGYYEYERAKQLPQGNNEWLLEARGKTLKIISALLPHLPMICRYRIIFMERDLQEVLASQRKMMIHRIEDHANTVTDNKMTEHLQQHLYEVETWLRAHREHLSCLRMNYNAVLKQPDMHIKQLNRYLGGNLDLARMISIVDPALYRNRLK